MTTRVKNLLEKAKADKEFQEELKVHEPSNYKISMFPTANEKLIYATLYMGWLIGKGTYNENDYIRW